MSVWAVVFARGGSKGLPGKNLKTLGGIPLIAHSIRSAQELEIVDAIFCSTDSDEIAAVAKQYGASVPFLRPSALADDTSPEWLSWKHFSEYLVGEGASPNDLILSLPTVAPLRRQEDVQNAIHRLQSSEADVVVSYTEAHRSPWFNMVAENEEGFLETVIEPAGHPIPRRQDSPRIYDLSTVVYASTIAYVLRAERMFQGKVAGVEVPKESAVDIDSQLDFEIAEFLWEKKFGADRSV